MEEANRTLHNAFTKGKPNPDCTYACRTCDKLVTLPLRNEEGLIHIFHKCPDCGEILWINDTWKRRRKDIKLEQLQKGKFKTEKTKQTALNVQGGT